MIKLLRSLHQLLITGPLKLSLTFVILFLCHHQMSVDLSPLIVHPHTTTTLSHQWAVPLLAACECLGLCVCIINWITERSVASVKTSPPCSTMRMSKMLWKVMLKILSKDSHRVFIIYKIPERILKAERTVKKRNDTYGTGLQGGGLWPVGLTPLPVTGSQSE